MLPDISNNLPFFLAIGGLILVLKVLPMFLKTGKRGKKTKAGQKGKQTHSDATQKAAFQASPLLNAPEKHVFFLLEAIVYQCSDSLRLLSQVSLGEFLQPKVRSTKDRLAAFNAINSKRVDFALMDADANVVLVVEYQGTGHFQGNAEQRDAVKRTALQKAGIPLIELQADFNPKAFQQEVEAVLGGSTLRAAAM